MIAIAIIQHAKINSVYLLAQSSGKPDLSFNKNV